MTNKEKTTLLEKVMKSSDFNDDEKLELVKLIAVTDTVNNPNTIIKEVPISYPNITWWGKNDWSYYPTVNTGTPVDNPNTTVYCSNKTEAK